MSAEPIYVIALGASTAVGRDAWSTAAAVRAGVSGFAEHPTIRDSDGEPVRAAIAPWLDIQLEGVERFTALLFPAIDQTLAAWHEINHDSLRLAMAIGLPEPHTGLDSDLHDRLINLLRAKYGPALSALATFPKGHAAGLLAIEAAANRLSEGRCDACVVAGVDSYIAPQTLTWLEQCDQLHGAGPQNNAWGFVPGEGAGALLLARRGVVEQRQLPPMLRLVGVGTAFEPKRIKTNTVCIGEGLTQAFRSAIGAMSGNAKITDVY
jgi:3-oxoacyl-[acyl-carrier-protein] synthase-1